MSQELETAISLLKSGERELGGRMLIEILDEDPQNELAWLWLSGAVRDADRRRFCLEQVLALNPNNEIAQKGLARLEQEETAARGMEAPGNGGTPSVRTDYAPVADVSEGDGPDSSSDEEIFASGAYDDDHGDDLSEFS